MSPFEAFDEAVRRAGGQAPFARMVGCTQGAVWQRLKAQKPISERWALKAEAGTGVPKELLCPDIYPREPATSAVEERASDLERAR